MPIHSGTQDRVISEVTTGSGTTSREGSVQSGGLLATLWVNSVTSGTLTVSVYTLTDTAKEVLLFSFTPVVAGSVDLMLRMGGPCMQRFRVKAVYTGVCSYEIYVRAVEAPNADALADILASSIEVNDSIQELITVTEAAGSTRDQVLHASDMVAVATYADPGVRAERITRVNYTSATVHPGVTVRKDITYTLASGTDNYIINTITWSLV